jgi:proteasome accessory factor C
LAKLSTVLGVSRDDAVGIELGSVPSDVLATVRTATDAHRKVRIDYYSFGADRRTTRVVQPWQVFNSAGQWYLSGWCERANGERLFRIDRIAAAQDTRERFVPPAEPRGPTELFHPDRDAPVIVLDLDADARWIAEQYPNDGVEVRDDGRLRVTLRVGERAWLERLLLRAGAAATVVEGDPGVGASAAARVLDRYRSADA